MLFKMVLILNTKKQPKVAQEASQIKIELSFISLTSIRVKERNEKALKE